MAEQAESMNKRGIHNVRETMICIQKGTCFNWMLYFQK